MLFTSVRDLLDSFRSRKRASRKRPIQKRNTTRLRIEQLEDRVVPSLTSTFELDGNATASNLIGTTADGSQTASHDWNQVYTDNVVNSKTTNTSGSFDTYFATDPVNSQLDHTFTSGNSKDVYDM